MPSLHMFPPLISCRALHPSILWAQRNDTILLTVNLNDIHHEKYSLEENVFQFTGVGGAEGQHYNVELRFFKDVIPQVRKASKSFQLQHVIGYTVLPACSGANLFEDYLGTKIDINSIGCMVTNSSIYECGISSYFIY